ncbi:hypothetical protein JOB18_010532 [Solea senegalensis]|uniref:Uncharacterized protein n=1 Tax=Solea senegalensis TaxID=28829 RepID=A0AAV6QTC8_SOLSE|nr:hypothetical protein JOB18_010532 [Solea senegalensis]
MRGIVLAALCRHLADGVLNYIRFTDAEVLARQRMWILIANIGKLSEFEALLRM